LIRPANRPFLPSVNRLQTAILISGRGSNMRALAAACRAPDAPAQIALVLANEPEAAGLAWAKGQGIATRVVCHRDYGNRAAFDAALDEALRAAGIQLVCLAGFMRILGDRFVESWRDRMVNIHPSLLPSFKGVDTHARALAAGVRIHGCTVHFVRPELDSGPILAQAAVAVRQDDTAETLAGRVLEAEHRIYPLALRLIAQGRVRVEGERVLIDGAAASPSMLLNPAP
jgi:phosphoribosylglycinamide formyltransferase-1